MKLLGTSLFALAAAKPEFARWHGDTTVATYEIIGAHYAAWSTPEAMFDGLIQISGSSQYDRMYHSTPTNSNTGGVRITFKNAIRFENLQLWTRTDCCRHDRYENVCLYADGVAIACTPNKYTPGNTIEFKDFLTKPFVDGQVFELKWPDNTYAQIAELYIDYAPMEHTRWHGDTSVASYEIIGAHYAAWSTPEAMFDGLINISGPSQYDRMYHSTRTNSNTGGVRITFKDAIRFANLQLWTRTDCCRDRYESVCLYADGVSIACTPNRYTPGDAIEFKDFMIKPFVDGRVFELKWPDNTYAQIAELYIEYS